MRSILLSIFIMCITFGNAQFIKKFGQSDSIPNNGKIRLISASLGTAYAGSTFALSQLWYSNLSGFRFFDDNQQWKQMDKIGHVAVAFHESRLTIDLLKWAGVEKKRAILIGGLAGFVMQTPIEILDGFSPSYGASWGDIIANTTGAALLTSQELLWDEIYIQPKYSFHTTPYPKIRPNTLGSALNEQILKDYNGQTLWLSANIYPLLKADSNFPKWINIAVGYGAYDMLYGSPEQNQENGYDAYRQWYLSADIDFTKIPTNKKGFKALFYVLNVIKIPFPTLEYNTKSGFIGHWLYF